MLGVYVALFFVAAQVISYFVFDQSPTLPVLVGGAFILVGGIIMTFWQGGLTSRPYRDLVFAYVLFQAARL
jgi:hypothetical protein